MKMLKKALCRKGFYKMTNDISFPSSSENKVGSLSHLWRLFYPLMLTALSGNLMLFMDKVLLSRFDSLAMAAVSTIGMIFTIFQLSTISIASIAEVFVGKSNGADEPEKIGPIVWQMVWFSLLTSIFFIPVGLFCGPYLIPANYHEYGIPYFKGIMIFGCMFPLVAALGSFYVGQGKVRLVTISTIVVNIINIILAYVFIFGFEPLIPSYGSLGAALASGISITIQAIWLFCFFLQKKYRERNNTHSYKFNKPQLMHYLKVGTPNAIGHLIEMTGWACLLQIMARCSEAHIMVLATGQAILVLLAFTTDGLQKALTVVASNIIGMKRLDLLSRLVQSGLKLHSLMILSFSVLFFFFSHNVIDLFYDDNLNPLSDHFLLQYANSICFWVLIYFALDGLVWISAGILTAFEDTFFVMAMNAICVWVAAIIPAYIIVNLLKTDASFSWKIMVLYALINAVGFMMRYLKWKRIAGTKISAGQADNLV